MNIFLTYDYELFFGTPTGTVEKCIIEPTDLLREMAKRTGIKLVFFIDTGYLEKLEELKDQFAKVKHEHQLVTSQIKTLVAEGHDCQLHIHPHWTDCKHDGTHWIMKTDRYKLVDFPDHAIEEMVLRHHMLLQNLTQKKVTSYRAGGWCLQPFSRIRPAFEKAGLRLDSSVFPGGKSTAGNYYYDFTSTQKKSTWKFSNDLCKEDLNGPFTEYPISAYRYNALFFWRLFVLGRLKPVQHKPMGDGYPMPSPGLRKAMLTKGKLLSASADGYFVTKLDAVLAKNQSNGFNEMVVLGHPKACTRFALKKLEQFINRHKNNHRFLTFAEVDLK
jgi:peptidoglycan/xylan/chitin deacetylase (PgdA/CDA1 family)